MRAKVNEDKPTSERTAGKSTSGRRDVAQETSSVEQETKKAGAVASAPDLSDDEGSGSDFSPEELSQTPLEIRKKQLVDSVMVVVMQCLDEKFPPKHHCRGDSSSARSRGACGGGGGRGAKWTGSNGNNDKENAAPQRLGKRQQRDGTPGGNGDGDGERGGKGNKRAKKDETGRKFACPFYKHAPSRYKNHRTCRLPRFPTVARVKEHIYRTHLNSLVCPRCGDKFTNDEGREAHLRADDMCKKKDLPPLYGVTTAQEKKLRERPKKGNSEEEQWVLIYKIIFPDTPADSIPSSPYCDDQEPQSLDGMHAFVRRELPRVVRLKLEEHIERIMDGAGADMKDSIINLLPCLIESLIEAYRGDMEQSEDETLAPVASAIVGANGPQPSGMDDGLYNGFEPYSDMLNLDTFPEFEGNILENIEGDGGLGSTSATIPFSF